jgi:hypothetical protein
LRRRRYPGKRTAASKLGALLAKVFTNGAVLLVQGKADVIKAMMPFGFTRDRAFTKK